MIQKPLTFDVILTSQIFPRDLPFLHWKASGALTGNEVQENLARNVLGLYGRKELQNQPTHGTDPEVCAYDCALIVQNQVAEAK
jgi:hypothetical protein